MKRMNRKLRIREVRHAKSVSALMLMRHLYLVATLLHAFDVLKDATCALSVVLLTTIS